MFNKVNRKMNAILMAVLVVACPSVTSANIDVSILEPKGVIVAVDHIQLVAHDGSATITGKFLTYNDGFYTVETPLGPLQVSEKWVRCEGALCPHIDAPDLQPNQVKLN